MRRAALAIVLSTVLPACGRGIDRSTAQVEGPRVLAVRAEPPESAPGGAVTYTALAATPAGFAADAAIDWSFCTSAALPAEDSSVSSACILAAGDPAAAGNPVALTTPIDACRKFGPLGTPTQAGKPAIQPAAPDASGGYYQPVRLFWSGSLTFASLRLTCPPVGVSLDLAQAYRAAARPNQNPQLLPLALDLDGAPVDLSAVAHGTVVRLTASWTAESAESYVGVAPQKDGLLTSTENLWLAWFVTGGTLEQDFTIPQAGDTLAIDHWQVPESDGTYHLWAVLHDNRGGVDFATIAVGVAR